MMKSDELMYRESTLRKQLGVACQLHATLLLTAQDCWLFTKPQRCQMAWMHQSCRSLNCWNGARTFKSLSWPLLPKKNCSLSSGNKLFGLKRSGNPSESHFLRHEVEIPSLKQSHALRNWQFCHSAFRFSCRCRSRVERCMGRW